MKRRLIHRPKMSLDGVTHITATVRNMAESERSWAGCFRVDAGVVDSVVPRQHLTAIGLSAMGTRIDESGKRVDVTTGRIEFMGEIVGATIVMGDEDAEPLLGATALESAGVEVDPRNQQLRRMPFVRLR